MTVFDVNGLDAANMYDNKTEDVPVCVCVREKPYL